MSDIRHAIPHLHEPDKTIVQSLVDFYREMKALEKDPQRGGKQATLIVMTLNDIKRATK